MSRWSKVPIEGSYKKFVQIFFEGELLMELPSSFARRLKLAEGIEQSEAANTLEEALLQAGYEVAISFLSVRALSQKEIEKKLRLQGLSELLVKRLMQKLKKYLNDQTIAERLGERLQGKPLSKRAKELQFKKRGLSPSGHLIEIDESQDAFRCLERWVSQSTKENDLKRFVMRLGSRGFEYSSIERALELIKKKYPHLQKGFSCDE